MSETVLAPLSELKLEAGVSFRFGKHFWRVLDVDEEKKTVFVISEKVICQKAYHKWWQDVTWEFCALRSWLNEEFIKEEFNEQEAEGIIESHLENHDNAKYKTPGGKDTNDRIFLLSIDEQQRYLQNESDAATGEIWFLRSPGYEASDAASVDRYGLVNYIGNSASMTFGVRPAFRLSLESDVCKSFIYQKDNTYVVKTPKIIIDGTEIKDLSTQVTYLQIPEGVTDIKDYCFANCKALSKVIIPASIKSIGAYAFQNCRNVELEFTDTVETINSKAFDESRCLVSFNRIAVTDKKLSSVLTKLNETGPLKAKSAAYLILFQTGKAWKDKTESLAKRIKTDDIVDAVIEIIQERKVTDGQAKNIYEYLKGHLNNLSPEKFNMLYGLLQEKKYKKTIEAINSDTLFSRFNNAENGEKAKNSENEIEDFVIRNWKEDAVTKKLSKIIKQGVHYKDSKKKCSANAVIFVFSEYERQIPEKRRGISVSGYQNDRYGFKVSTAADKVAAELNRDELGNLAYKLGLFPSLGRFGSEKNISDLVTSMNKWKDWYSYGLTGRQNIILARGALFLSDTRAAMLAIDKVGQLGIYAGSRGISENDLRDLVLSDIGLDSDGKKVYDLGTKQIEVSLNDELAFTLYDPEAQKIVKSMPKKGTDPDKVEKAASDYSALKKNSKKIIKSRIELLEDAFINGNSKQYEKWTKVYLGNPLFRTIARLIVWKSGDLYFTVSEKELINFSGNPVTPDEKKEVQVAHPMDMKKEEIEGWQKYFISKGLKQPFTQIWEPIINLIGIRSDRYKGIDIPFYRFSKKEKLGIYVVDENYHEEVSVHFDCCTASVDRKIWRRHSLNVDDPFEISYIIPGNHLKKVNRLIAYLDKITIYERIKNNDETIVNLLDEFTIAQITEFINLASENNAVNVQALLMNYKNSKFIDFDPMSEFTLDL